MKKKIENLTISVEELLDFINKSSIEENKLSSPILVWFDTPNIDLLKYTHSLDSVGLAQYVYDVNKDIAVYDAGPLPLSLNEDKSKLKINPTFFENRKDKSSVKCVLVAPGLFVYDKEQLESLIEMSRIVHRNMRLSAFLILPSTIEDKLKDRFKLNVSDFQELHCVQSSNTTEAKDKWLEQAGSKSERGFQIVDNFYLDYIRKYKEKAYESAKLEDVIFSHALT